MNGLPYYKAYPRDFIEGTIGMDFETKGAYRLVLDLIYMQGGKLPDDARYISGLLGCSVRKWNTIRDRLLEAGKLDLFEGFISNKVARKQLESLRKLQEQNAENRRGHNKNKDLEKRPSNHTEPEPDIEKGLSKDNHKNTPSASVVSKPKSDRQIFVEALAPILGDELANDIAKHRTKLKAPNTPRAATGLVGRLQKCPDPVFAANEMILRGWKSVEPEWLERSGASPSQSDEGSIYTRILERNGHFQ